MFEWPALQLLHDMYTGNSKCYTKPMYRYYSNFYAIRMHVTLTFMQYVRLKLQHSHGTHASNYVTPTRLHDVCSVNLSMISDVTVGRGSTVHQCNSNFYKKLMIRFILHRIHVYRTHLSFAGISPYSRRRSHTTSPTPC